MACRCDDISDCKNDISVINSILGICRSIKSTNEEVSDSYGDLVNLCKKTFIAQNMNELNNAQKELNDDITSAAPKMIDTCETKIENLESQLEAMKEEDHRYHEEQNRKKNK